MKFVKRLFRLFSIKGKNALKKAEDSIEIYEYELQKSKENLDKLAESQSKLHASRQLVIDKKNKAAVYVKSLDAILEKAADQNDTALGEQVIGLIEANQTKVVMHQTAEDSYTHALETLEVQHESLKSRLNEKFAQLDGLKAKNEFAKNMQVVNKELKTHYADNENGFDSTNFQAIEEELQGKIYLEQNRNQRFTPQATVEDLVNLTTRKSKFEDYMKQRDSLKIAPLKSLDAPKAVETLEARQLVELRVSK